MARHAIAALLSAAVSTVWQLPSLAQSEQHIPVGTDQFSGTTVYLDLQRVEKVDPTSYKYTIFSDSNEGDTGKPGRFEEDIVVNCNQTGLINHLGSRLYGSEGRLIKTDPPPGTQDVSSQSGFAPYLNANQTVCKGGR
ncbi:MAG TPA: hypothetical protein V6C90_11390 [Coleofasciculaceae cyanobacterium]|jgi:hypothetical protein